MRQGTVEVGAGFRLQPASQSGFRFRVRVQTVRVRVCVRQQVRPPSAATRLQFLSQAPAKSYSLSVRTAMRAVQGRPWLPQHLRHFPCHLYRYPLASPPSPRPLIGHPLHHRLVSMHPVQCSAPAMLRSCHRPALYPSPGAPAFPIPLLSGWWPSSPRPPTPVPCRCPRCRQCR